MSAIPNPITVHPRPVLTRSRSAPTLLLSRVNFHGRVVERRERADQVAASFPLPAPPQPLQQRNLQVRQEQLPQDNVQENAEDALEECQARLCLIVTTIFAVVIIALKGGVINSLIDW